MNFHESPLLDGPEGIVLTEDFTVRLLKEDENPETVEVSRVVPLKFQERPGVGSWKVWRWRPWLRFRREAWEFDAIMKDDGNGNQSYTVVGMVTELVTFHRNDPTPPEEPQP